MKTEVKESTTVPIYGIWDHARSEWIPSFRKPDLFTNRMEALARVKFETRKGRSEVVRVFGEYKPGEIESA